MRNPSCGQALEWTGLYRKDYDLATPESMAHPAKVSWDLAFKIIELLEATGWTIADYHQAVLFEEQAQGHLFEGQVKKVKGRLSFFKRLAYGRGSPVSNFEHVIFARR